MGWGTRRPAWVGSMATLRSSAAFALAVMAAGTVSGATSPPAPGTPTQVAERVRASIDVTHLSPAEEKRLAAGRDDPQRLYPAIVGGCAVPTKCVFGETSSKRVLVLFGDSHAAMWLPALDPVAKALGLKLVGLWQSACPVADVTGFRYVGEFATTDPGCASWRSTTIATIMHMNPTAVLMAERTAGIVQTSGSKRFTSAQWAKGLETTIGEFAGSTFKLGLVQDVQFFTADPLQCLAAFPTAIQSHCSIANPNPRYPGQQVAEGTAARATGTTLIRTLQWFCTSRCSPVIGGFISYYDQGHVSASYARYLTLVVEGAVKRFV